MTVQSFHMARNGPLNPTSVPFFPGGNGLRDDHLDGAFDPHHSAMTHDMAGNTDDRRSPASSLHETRVSAPSRADGRQSRGAFEDHRGTPGLRQSFADRPYSQHESRNHREQHSLQASVDSLVDDNGRRASMVEDFSPSHLEPFRDPFQAANPRQRDRFMSFQGVPFAPSRNVSSSHGHSSIAETADEGWEFANPNANEPEALPPSRQRMGSEPFLGGVLTRPRERNNGASMAGPIGSRGSSYQNQSSGHYNSSASPVSSIESVSHASSVDTAVAFEAQLKSSAFMREVLDRLSVCELSTHEIKRDLSEVHRKIDVLLQRSPAAPPSAAPEFKDPFASASNSTIGPRGSYANIPPNQVAPVADMSSIDQRLNTLTNSLGQLLALQTQSLNVNGNFNGMAALNAGVQALDVSPQMYSPPSASSMPMRSPGNTRGSGMSPNAGTPAGRGWSVGNLDTSQRAFGENSPGNTPQSRTENLLNGRSRRSVMGLTRQNNPPQFSPLPTTNETWSPSTNTNNATVAASPRVENNPTLSKWDQLPLSPPVIQSLSKFGVGPPNKIQQRAIPFLLNGADIIAQAPPTQERIAAYVIPAIQIALNFIASSRQNARGPLVVLVSTTVDQATQAQRMIRDLGGPIGVRSALGVGATNGDVSRELGLLSTNMPHILCGTPQKLHALFTSQNGLPGGDVRFLVLDEVDQLIARNLHEYVFSIVKLLPSPRRGGPQTSPSQASDRSSFEMPSGKLSQIPEGVEMGVVERQTALFSNTVPQDVLNLANAIQLREPVRVLVRRDGTVTQTESSGGTKGLRQYYLYLAFTAGGRGTSSAASDGGLGAIGSGRGSASAETAQAREWKLDALADVFDDVDLPQAIVYVSGLTALDAVVYKLASRGVDAVALHGDMNATTKMAAITKFRGASTMHMRPNPIKVLVVYDVQLKPAEVAQIPLIVNYDLPKAVEEYAHRVAPAIASNFSRAGVIINFVTATGGDVEMLRSIECFYKMKCPEVPMSLRDIF